MKRFVATLAIAILGLAAFSLRSSSESTLANFDRVVIPVGEEPGSIAIADVNRDGKPDILVVNKVSETLLVLLGDGTGHFRESPVRCPTGKQPNDIAVGDFNNDGNPDVVIPNTETPYLTILLGDGRGGFKPSPHSPFDTRSHPHVHGVAAADFNADGKLDVVTDNWGRNQILMFLGDGQGNLALPGKPFDTGKRPYERVRSADFNKDGNPDIVATDLDQNAVSILLGDGKGGLRNAPGSPFPAGVFPWAVAVDDANKDGNLDLAVIPYDRDITNQRQLGVTVLLGDGKGGFTTMRGSPFSLAGCQGPSQVAVGDLNGDGMRDIVVACAQNNKLMLLMATKDGGFQTSSIDVPTGWSGMAVGDLNGDKKDDVVVSNNPTNHSESHSGTVTILLSK